MSIVYRQYIVPCVDEGIGITTGFVDSVPTVCPHNNQHTIEPTGIRVVATLGQKTVTVDQGGLTTGGYFRTDFYSMTATANSVTTKDITYPYNVNVFLAGYRPTTDNTGDSLDIIAVPNTPCARTGQDITAGVNSFYLSPVYTTISAGFSINITDGVNTDDLGEVISIDLVTGVATFTVPTIHAFASGSLLKLSVPRIRNFKFVNNDSVVLGKNKVVASGWPAGKVIRITYTNNSSVDKEFNFYFEIGY